MSRKGLIGDAKSKETSYKKQVLVGSYIYNYNSPKFANRLLTVSCRILYINIRSCFNSLLFVSTILHTINYFLNREVLI